MKKRIVLFVLVISALVCTSVYALSFTDIDTKDAKLNTAVEELVKLNIVEGYEDNTFRPENYVTRAEMAQLCRNLLPPYKKGVSTFNASNKFLDIDSKHWAADSMGIMIDMKFMQGYGDNTIKPDSNVTLSEASAILSRMLGYEETAQKLGAYPNGYLAVMDELGITEDLENVKADQALTRSMVTLLLHKTLDAPMQMMTGYDLQNGATYVQDSNHTYRNLLLNYK